MRSTWSNHHILRFSTLFLKLTVRLILKKEYGVLEGPGKGWLPSNGHAPRGPRRGRKAGRFQCLKSLMAPSGLVPLASTGEEAQPVAEAVTDERQQRRGGAYPLKSLP